ncbi:UNVERIFIED_CONTAM: hypothetical protein FKN15_005649 [Acipenser sinensis]
MTARPEVPGLCPDKPRHKLSTDKRSKKSFGSTLSLPFRHTGPASSLHPSPRKDPHRTVHVKRIVGSEQHLRGKGLYGGLWLAEGQ